MLRLAVSDTSMSPISAKLANLTAPFSEATFDRARHGTGIGLSLAQQLAELMGGRLTVRHSTGRGTIMIFTGLLPSAVQADQGSTKAGESPGASVAKTPQTAPQSALQLNLADSGTKSVLLVDDNPSTRALIESMLDKNLFRVATCSNGRDALQALSIAPYDIVLMDLHMPEMDGTAAVQNLRAREAQRGLPRTPVIALGDAPFDLERQRCLAAGFDLHMSKPVRKSRLLEGMASLIASRPESSTSHNNTVAIGQRYAHRDALSLLAQGRVIDVSAAVEGLGGNAAIYLHAVEQLTPALSNWPARFRDTLGRGETERARQMALDMQSILDVVRAGPCAEALGRLAAVLAQPTQDHPLRDKAVAELDQEMHALLLALRQAVERLRQGRSEQTRKDHRQNSAL
jgi:CheY-like chemotaxis protein